MYLIVLLTSSGAVGLVREDGLIDYLPASQVLALAPRDECLRQLMLRFAVDNFREELKKKLGLPPSNVNLSRERALQS
jgi:hypothetical protein